METFHPGRLRLKYVDWENRAGQEIQRLVKLGRPFRHPSSGKQPPLFALSSPTETCFTWTDAKNVYKKNNKKKVAISYGFRHGPVSCSHRKAGTSGRMTKMKLSSDPAFPREFKLFDSAQDANSSIPLRTKRRLSATGFGQQPSALQSECHKNTVSESVGRSGLGRDGEGVVTRQASVVCDLRPNHELWGAFGKQRVGCHRWEKTAPRWHPFYDGEILQALADDIQGTIFFRGIDKDGCAILQYFAWL